MLDQTSEAPSQAAQANQATSPRKRRRRRPSLRTTLVFTHRWTALLLGIALLAVAISGVVLLYEREIDRLVHPGLHRVTDSPDPITHAEALAAGVSIAS